MLALDAFLLTRVFTPIAWWIERRTGRNNFRQAEWCLKISAGGAMVFFAAMFVLHERWVLGSSAATLMSAMLLPPLAGWSWVCLDTIKLVRLREQLRALKPDNAFDLNLDRHRVVLLVLFVVSDTALLAINAPPLTGIRPYLCLTFFYNVPNTFARYMMSVPGAPPKPKKHRDWFLRPVPVPT